MPTYCFTLLAGKTALVTGATSGIGLETAAALSSAGCRVLLCARNVNAGAIALATLSAPPSQPGGACAVPALCNVVAPLDLEDVASVRAAAAATLEALHGAPLDLLVGNAGIMALPTREEACGGRGWEKQMATNHFGHHLLVSLLRPQMAAQSAPARIVLLSSSGHQFGTVNVDDLHFATPARPYSAWGAYGQSKLANILEAKELSDQLEGTNVTAVAVHPGVIKTNLMRHMPVWGGGGVLATLSLAVIGPFVFDKSIPQGAATTLYACLAPDIPPGSYLVDCAVAQPRDAAVDADKVMRRALWRVTEEQIQAALADLDAAAAPTGTS
jgi:NAD(P)-dependent dehydrogenase (short-subunit alcohol dehydrogenase family)